MDRAWYRDLYKIRTVTGVKSVAVRVALAVGLPLIGGVLLGHPAAAFAGGATALFVTMSDIGTSAPVRLGTMLGGLVAIIAGGTLGHELGGTRYANETVVLASAIVAGWASGSQPGIAAITRFFAIAAAAGTGMHFTDPDVLLCVLAGGASAFAAAAIAWVWFRVPPEENDIDWRAGVRRAFAGTDAGIRYTICYAAAAAVALFAASALGTTDPFWATLVVLMAMRREGTAGIRLNVHYAAGTLLGVLAAAAILHFVETPLVLAVLATAVAASARIGFALNPALCFTAFTMFLLLGVHVTTALRDIPPHLLAARIYDVSVGCVLALIGTLATIYPRLPANKSA